MSSDLWRILALSGSDSHAILAWSCDINVVANHVSALVETGEEDIGLTILNLQVVVSGIGITISRKLIHWLEASATFIFHGDKVKVLSILDDSAQLHHVAHLEVFYSL